MHKYQLILIYLFRQVFDLSKNRFMYLDVIFLVRMGSALTTDTIQIKLMISTTRNKFFLFTSGVFKLRSRDPKDVNLGY